MNVNGLNNERELIIRLAAGDEGAFDAIYHLYSARLLGNVIKMVKSETLASEILQDIFIKLWNNRQRIDPDQSFRSWLFKIGENVVYDFFRRAARDKILQETLIHTSTDFYLHVEESLLDKEKFNILRKAIDALPPQRRQVFNLCRTEGKSYQEVSELLGISTSTISDHIVKANRFIFQYFSRDNKLIISALAVLMMS